MPFFKCEHITVGFGGLRALDNINLEVNRGEIFSIIGPNGAGKTTLFNCINRFYDPDEGEILFKDKDITRIRPYQVAELGISRTFQNIELFKNTTVLDNLLLARHRHRRTNLITETLFLQGVRRQEIESREKAEEIIDFLEIEAYRDQIVASLPYGIQKIVELGRALTMGPDLLLLDEPSSGMNIEESEDLTHWITDIKEELGITILLVEHNMRLVMDISDRVLALNFGKVISEGPPKEVQEDPEVIKAYLEINMALLKVSNIETYYGAIMAIKGVSLEIEEADLVTILGANGAGKSTILKTISGVMDPEKGVVEFKGQHIERMDPAKIVRLGISNVPEGREIFYDLSVKDNLMMGTYVRKDREEINKDLAIMHGYFPILRARSTQLGGSLSGGEQQMLAIARALMARPSLLLMDEASLGLSPILIKEIFTIVKRINEEQKTAILMVEQNAKIALSVARYGYILELGRMVMADTCQELLQNEDVKEFYLGVKGESVRGQKRWKRKKKWR